MSIVFACAASHAPGMTAWPEAAPTEQADRFLANYRKLGAMLAATKPDALVAITVEHWANFFLNHMPTFCIGRADHYEGPVEEWLKIPKTRVPGDSQLGAELLIACLDGGFDPTFSDELLFDHATMLPLHFLNPNMAIAVVPVIINTLTDPMPVGGTLPRAWRASRKGTRANRKARRRYRHRGTIPLARRSETRKNQYPLRQEVPRYIDRW
jgi:aromatic ring-opening dioxygenase catalytic subunit (LigB family)